MQMLMAGLLKDHPACWVKADKLLPFLIKWGQFPIELDEEILGKWIRAGLFQSGYHWEIGYAFDPLTKLPEIFPNAMPYEIWHSYRVLDTLLERGLAIGVVTPKALRGVPIRR